jgi:D-galactarolactone cycloisomerase
MNRRQFIAAAAGLSVGATGLLNRSASAADRSEDQLSKHRLAAIEFKQIDTSWPRPVGRNAVKGVHGHKKNQTVCILTTNQGASGWGIIRGNRKSVEAISERVQGKAVSELFAVDRGVVANHLLPLDFALHDLAGVILETPVWKMVAGGERTKPFVTRVYSGMIYFDDLDPPEKPAGVDKLIEECQWDYDYGYRQFKVKIGRGHRWMKPSSAGMKRDILAVKEIHKAFPACDILVDANNGYSVDDSIEFLSGIESVPLFWLEEPFHETVDDYRKLHAWALANRREKMLLADGEARPDTKVLEQLQAENILDVRLEDIAGLGFTTWRRLLPNLLKQKIQASPHAWGSGLKTIYAAHLVGGLGGAPTIEGVTMAHADVDIGENVIREGNQQVSSDPGFGLRLI